MKLTDLFSNIADGVRGLFSEKSIIQRAQQANITELQARQALWRQVYQNKAPWLVPGKIYSANLAAIASGEVARLITLDIRAGIDSSPELNDIFQKEMFWDIRNQVEYGLAFGGVIIKPYMSAGIPRITFAQSNEYEIIQVDTDGTILDCYFKDYEQILVDSRYEYLVRVEHHKYNRNTQTYQIINEIYRSDETGMIGTQYFDVQAQFNRIQRWQGIQVEQTLTNVKHPLFGFFKPATSNTIDTKSPYGVSIFDKALQTIMLADRQLSGLVREFKIKEGKLYVDRLALEGTQRASGSLPYLDDDFYVKMDVDPKQGSTFFEVFSPEIRSEHFLRVFNKYQQLVEDNIGLMHGTFSAPDITDRTATEVRESKHKTYSTVSANQKALQKALQQAINAVAFYLNIPTAEVTIIFDDSLLRDPDEVLNSMRDDVSMGLIRPELYLSRKYNISEEEAREFMPRGTQLLRGANTLLTWNDTNGMGE